MKAKAKGSRVEREVRKLFEAHGWKVVRSAGSFGESDLYIHNKEIGISLGIQVKARKSLQVYSWLGKADALILKGDRKEFLIVLPLEKFLQWIGRK